MKSNITDNESLHSFFSYVSKVVLIIPIFILVIALFFKFNQPKNSITNNLITPTVVPTIKAEFKFDLNGPIICENLFIQDKKVLLKNKSTHYLLNGDCLYIWETGKFNGEKKCDLSNYINMAENYLGFLSIDDLLHNSLIKDKIKNKDIDLAKVLKSCKRGGIKDKTIFEIPKKVVFKS
ncbi:MAG: hypothetical protein AAB705_00875 [Patescibacteria group bacterium]|mgnify:FL=1